MKCCICNSSNLIVENILKTSRIDIIYKKCPDCGLIFNPDNKIINKIKDYYNDKYYWQEREGNYFLSENIRYKTAVLRINLLKKYIDTNTIKTVLEIGASTGTFIKAFQDIINCKCVGIDISNYAVDFGIKNNKVNLIAKDFESFKPPAEKFDMICFWGTISKFSNINIQFNKIYDMLSEKGFIFFNFSNSNSFIYRVQQKNYFQYQLGTNYIFSDKSIFRLLKNHNFDIKLFKMETQYVSIKKMLHLILRLKLDKFKKYSLLEKVHIRFPTFINYIVLAQKSGVK